MDKKDKVEFEKDCASLYNTAARALYSRWNSKLGQDETRCEFARFMINHTLNKAIATANTKNLPSRKISKILDILESQQPKPNPVATAPVLPIVEGSKVP